MGHRGKGGWGGAGPAPPPDYALSASDAVVRSGMATSPTNLAGQRIPDVFAVTPATNASVSWRTSSDASYGVSILNPSPTPYLFWPDTALGDWAAGPRFVAGPATGPIGSPTAALADGPCTIVFSMWAHGIIGLVPPQPFYAGLCSVRELVGGWERCFSAYYSGANSWVGSDAQVYVTLKPGAAPTTVYGTASSLGQTGDGTQLLCVFRQTATTATFTTVSLLTGLPFPGSYSEARVPGAGQLWARFGFVSGGDVVPVWRAWGCMIWEGGTFIPDADIASYATLYFNYP